MINSQAARDNPAVDVAFLPPSKATNKRIFPVQNTGGVADEKGMQTPPVNPKTPVAPATAVNRPGGGLLSGAVNVGQPKTEDPFRTPDFNPNSNPTDAVNQPPATTATPQKNGGGLLQNLTNAPAIGISAAVKSAATPLTYKPQDYKPVSSDAAATAPTMNVPTVTAPSANYTPVTQNLQTSTPAMNVPGSSFTPGSFQKDGYTGVKGNADFSYTPDDESLVENRIGGLLDPKSALMRKAAALGNSYAANRGLQSSSIGGEIALSTMVDKALPIAQQDAQTFNQAQQLGWQQSWQSGENNLGRTHDASMADKQGQYQTNLQNTQLSAQSAENAANRTMQAEMAQLQYKQSLNMLDAQGAQRMQELNTQLGFQANESNAGRQMQAELQQLQYKQSLGQLDAQGAQRMQELNAQAQISNFQQERGAQLQTERDQLLQQMQLQNMDKSYLQNLELNKAQYDQQDRTFAAQLEAGKQAEYRNAVSTAYNNYLSQVGAIYADPNMTSEQKAAGAAYLQQQLSAQRMSLETLYAVIGAPATGAVSTTTPPTGTTNPTNPPVTTNPVYGGGNPSGWKNGTQVP